MTTRLKIIIQDTDYGIDDDDIIQLTNVLKDEFGFNTVEFEKLD